MSTPGSPAPSEIEAARAAADRARSRPPVSADPRFAALRGAAIAAPGLVTSPKGAPAHWLVPFAVDGRACGVARVALDARDVDVSVFGAGAADRDSWPDVAFFAGVPGDVLAAVANQHPGRRWAPPRLSYDGSPHRWGWRLDTDPPGALVVFVTTGGWYARDSPPPVGREG